MNCERGIRFDLLARLCPNCTGLFVFISLWRHLLYCIGADIRSVCTEAGMFAIRSRKKVCPIHSLVVRVNDRGTPECFRKELFGRGQQGHQGLRQILRNTKIHGLF